MQGELQRYNDIIQTQLSQGIVERTDEVVKDGREFYIPHEAVVRENAESRVSRNRPSTTEPALERADTK